MSSDNKPQDIQPPAGQVEDTSIIHMPAQDAVQANSSTDFWTQRAQETNQNDPAKIPRPVWQTVLIVVGVIVTIVALGFFGFILFIAWAFSSYGSNK